jgi:adenine deaminase
VLSDLQAMRVDLVFASGRVVSQDGQTTVALPDAPPPPRGTMQLPHFAAADFAIAAQGSTARLRTVDRPRFTRWGETAAGITDGAVVLPDDAIYMAVVHRHGLAPAIPVMGVLREWGHWRGAIATTVAHDSHNLVVFGRDAADLAAAANAVTEAGGGMAVASGGIVRAVLPLPICGLISDASTAELATQLAILRQAADAVVPWDPPMLTFKSLVGASLACNPGPHVTDMGITDGSTGEVYASALIDG